MAIPTKTYQPSMGKVEIWPQYDLQTSPNNGSNMPQKTGKLALRICYHRLDTSPLPRQNLPSILHRMAPIPTPPAQERTGQSHTLKPCQQSPSTIPSLWQHTNQRRIYLRTGSKNHGNLTHAGHKQSRHHTTSLEYPDTSKWRHSAAHSPGDQEWNDHSIQWQLLQSQVGHFSHSHWKGQA